MPLKFNAPRRHKFDKAPYRVTNWSDCNESLRQRGDLTILINENTQGLWIAPRRTSRCGQRKYSDLAIELCLSLRTAYRLGLRRTQGLMGSIAKLMGLDIRAPDYSTLARRASVEIISPVMRQGGSVPLHLAVDTTGLKIFGEGGGNGSLGSIKPGKYAAAVQDSISDWSWSMARLFAPI